MAQYTVYDMRGRLTWTKDDTGELWYTLSGLVVCAAMVAALFLL